MLAEGSIGPSETHDDRLLLTVKTCTTKNKFACSCLNLKHVP